MTRRRGKGTFVRSRYPRASGAGDTATLLGSIGEASVRAELTALLEDPNPDVAELAAEALEEIEERAG